MVIFARNFAGSDLPPPAAISGDQGINFGKCPIYRGDSAEISAEVSVFSKWARHRGDVRNFKGFVPGFGKIRGGCKYFGIEPVTRETLSIFR
ncbi:pyrimidine 2 [Prunus dulcis]|uniref:Pyrimidine 2 n=1 Tax=Prunus dulcis TaxID=3755 RepID=A0A4Y1RSI4_PRUDU|nr:pyrimidine 2 [Prunus dulcis]